MDNINWEYEAPKFIDFEANEHLLDNVDEYFDHAHESSTLPANFDQDILDDKSSENTETPNGTGKLLPSSIKEKFTASTPSRVLRSNGSIVGCKTNENSSKMVAESDSAQQKLATLNIDNNLLSKNAAHSTPSRKTFDIVTPSRVLRSNVRKDVSFSTPTQADAIAKPSGADASFEQKENKPKVYHNVMTPSRIASWYSDKKREAVKKSSLRRSITKKIKTEETLDPPRKKAKKENVQVNLRSSADGAIPHSHKYHKRNLTSEERELEKIKKLRSDAKLLREKSKMYVKKLEKHIQNPGTKPHVTKTEEFHFETDVRVAKMHNMFTRSDAADTSNFESGLRKYAPSPLKKPKNTVVKPFNLTQNKRKCHEEQQQIPKFVPMAKAILDFQSRTPRRYRLTKDAVENKSSKPLRATIPHTPNITKAKHRPATVLSYKEKEEIEVQEMKHQQFKAKPLNSAILEGPKQGKKVEKKPSTVPVEFHLSSKGRTVRKDPEHEENPKRFKAQPVPEFIFHKPSVKKKQSLEVTVPQSPAFALKNRVRNMRAKEGDDVQPLTFYHPPPKSKTVFKPKLHSNKTEPQPFSFDVKDKDRMAKKEEKIKEIVERETSSTTFKAQHMPISLSPSESLPLKRTKEPTKVEPFHLECHERVAMRVSEWEKQVQKDVNEMREKALFKANQDYEKIVKGKPWEPKLDHKPSTDPLKVVLRSEVRSKDREEFNKRLQVEKEEEEHLLKEEQMRQEEIARKEVESLRKNLVHKAHDVRKFKGVKVTKSSKPLTLPESPKFSTRFNK